MKKIILFVALLFGIGNFCVNAQTTKTEENGVKTKTKPRTTVGDKAHNIIHPHHKKHHGWKKKQKPDDDMKTKGTTKKED